ncbi:hypothetical protein [Streptomyces sp. NPDC060198]|uniref:hypothetical protein n=1 Tax=Streptomyces sp. NPDC060198 TaxID=3347070 RepID=UPI00364F301E
MARLGTPDVKFELKSEARRAVLRVDPTEKPGLVLLGTRGPAALAVGALGPMGLLLIYTYFITVADRSLYVHRGPRLRNRPEELVHVIPRDQTGGLVARVKRGKARNALYLRLPGKARPTRLNVSYHSRDELERFLREFPEGGVRAEGARSAR